MILSYVLPFYQTKVIALTKSKIRRLGPSMHLAASVFLGMAVALGISSSACALSPGALKGHLKKISKTPVYNDPELAAYIEDVGQKVAAVSHEPNVVYQFFILDTDNTNAEATDEGLVYIDRGLLTVLTSEGQLAGVLAHEVGHHTGHHKSRLKTKHALGNFGEVLASILAGNSSVGSALDASNNVRLLKFKREVELEADQFAAEYLYKSGYDPEEMLGVLGVLKDQSTLLGQVKGINASYHGVFATHPRSDKRLQEVIRSAGELPPGEAYRGREKYRKMISGVVFGPNYTGNKRPDQERFTHKTLGITFLRPKDWTQTTKGKNIVLKDADKSIQLKISIEKTVDKKLSSQEVLEAKYPDDLRDLSKIDEKATKDLGTIARRPEQRVAVIQVGRNTFYFQGIAKNNKLSDEQDKAMLEIIKSFRRAARQDLSPDAVKRIYFKRLEPGETFATLARDRQLGKYTELYLRVMNGYYPKGEAEPGTYIKLVKSAKNFEKESKEKSLNKQ
ncbi:MAG: putative Zn-dependent protease [Arenicella sp.]|jgi:predicted Zn-dependent protease